MSDATETHGDTGDTMAMACGDKDVDGDKDGDGDLGTGMGPRPLLKATTEGDRARGWDWRAAGGHGDTVTR